GRGVARFAGKVSARRNRSSRSGREVSARQNGEAPDLRFDVSAARKVPLKSNRGRVELPGTRGREFLRCAGLSRPVSTLPLILGGAPRAHGATRAVTSV